MTEPESEFDPIPARGTRSGRVQLTGLVLPDPREDDHRMGEVAGLRDHRH